MARTLLGAGQRCLGIRDIDHGPANDINGCEVLEHLHALASTPETDEVYMESSRPAFMAG